MAVKKLLFLFTDTGGGHRSACEATIEACHLLYPGKLEITMVDFPKTYTPFPFNRIGPTYPYMVKLGSYPWEIGFELTNSPARMSKIIHSLWPILQPAAHRVISDNPADLIVSFHPLFNYPLITALRETKSATPFITVITDLVGGHTSWYTPGAAKYLVPTSQAYEIALSWNVPENRLINTGLPISPRFKNILKENKSQLRRQLNLNPKLTTILLMGGGQGIGNLKDLTEQINLLDQNLQIIVVAGRNPHLESDLNHLPWKIPHLVFGFTKEIPTLMQASDLIITKAGPSTLAESLTCKLPVLISGFIRGQETGNVYWLIDHHAGIYTPTIPQTLSSIRYLASHPRQLKQYRVSAQKISRPDAAFDVAREIYRLVS